jgi:hypothetical protein
LLAGAPILFIKKKDSSLYLYIDYRGLNKVIIKNYYPLLLIIELLERLFNIRIFSKFNMQEAYYRIRIKKENK